MKLGASDGQGRHSGTGSAAKCWRGVWGRSEEGDNTNMLYYELKLGCDLLIYGFGQNG